MKILNISLITLMAALALSITACSGKSEPEHRTFNLEISGGKINLKDEDLKVTQGDTVTMTIASDEHGLFHLHGYDREIPVGPGEAAELTFDASATGRFDFTLHPGAEEGATGHGAIFESGTLEKGQSFTFTIPDELAGQEIAYHNHMNHEQTGTIIVSGDPGVSGDVQVEVLADGAFSPQKVTVGVGSSVVWTNTVDERARIASGPPPGSSDQAHEHSSGEEEIDLGAIEVHPR